MRRLLHSLLFRPTLWIAARLASSPDPERVNHALTGLLQAILKGKEKKGMIIPFTSSSDKFIIFSDQHKGAKNGADDFALAEPNYVEALNYYDREGFHLIILGDCEELWENSLAEVKRHNRLSIEVEKKFVVRKAFTKIFGNHDLTWENDPLASLQLKAIYKADVSIYEGVVLETRIGKHLLMIYCTHGHQGDSQSDGNWFSKFFVSRIWGPLQSYLEINPNTPSCNDNLKTAHNQMMYDWSSQQKDLLLITGHTHQPVFKGLTQLERLYRTEKYLAMKPGYFNSGCCCFNDGDITGIEIADEKIRLIKWKQENQQSTRTILEEAILKDIANQIN